MKEPNLTVLAVVGVVAFIVLSVQTGNAAIDVHVDVDPKFDFTQAHTVAWNPDKAGYVFMARTADDDPEVVRKQAEPVVVSAVNAEMPKHGLTLSTNGTADLTVTYYLLLTFGSSAQTLGQFLPPVTDWGVPPFVPSTQSLKVVRQGSLIIDLIAKGEVVWRGAAEAEIKMGLTEEKRRQLIRDAVTQILKDYPPKPKK